MKVLKNVFVELLPFSNWALKTFYKDICKTIIARSFKNGQLIEDEEKITWLK